MPEKNEPEKKKVRKRSRWLAVAAEVVAGNSTRRAGRQQLQLPEKREQK